MYNIFMQTQKHIQYLLNIILSLTKQPKCAPHRRLYHVMVHVTVLESKKTSNDQELIQSDPISCPQNQKGNN